MATAQDPEQGSQSPSHAAHTATDSILPFAVDALDVRGRLVRLDGGLNALLTRQNYPDPVAKLVGQAVALTLMLASSVKLEGRLILQAQTNGLVPLLVVDMKANGDFRATAKFDADGLTEIGEIADRDLGKLLGTGTLALTIDQGQYMNRYQGFVELTGGSLEEAAHNYFARSEQIPTRIKLAVGQLMTRSDTGQTITSWVASGMMMQFLPEAGERIVQRDLPAAGVEDEAYLSAAPKEDDAWLEALALMETLDDGELADPDLPSERLLYRLFHERGVRVFDQMPVQENCTCSAEKLRNVLKELSPAERADSVAESGLIEAKCEFCGRAYQFDPAGF